MHENQRRGCRPWVLLLLLLLLLALHLHATSQLLLLLLPPREPLRSSGPHALLVVHANAVDRYEAAVRVSQPLWVGCACWDSWDSSSR